jgi:hypothetical protein
VGAVGGDIIPDNMMLPSIRDRMQRNVDKAARETSAVLAAKMSDLISDFADALRDGETEVARELAEKLATQSAGRLRLDGFKEGLAGELEARNLAGNLRNIAGSGKYADIFMEIYMQGGLGFGER